jgi:CelD/BcsL family acetyltransferase involved in cellulose biosynthesis
MLETIDRRSGVALSGSTVPPTADRCEIVRDFSRLEALASEWSRLWAADPRAEVFQSFLWNRAWWRACGGSVELCTPVVFAGSELLGILPVIRRNGRLEFLGAPQADYGDVICSDEDTPQVLEWSLRELQTQDGWREGLLDGLPEEARIVRHWAKLPGDLRGNLQLVASEKCYTILLNDKPEILGRLASKQHLRRRQNKIEKAGKVVFRHLESVPEALQHLEMFFVCQRRRRAIHGKTSAAENEEFRQLLRRLVQEFDLKTELHFGALELDSRPLAWHLSFEVHDKLVFYQQTFEVDGWDFAPGDVLLRYLLLFAKDRVHREFDFTRGDEPFKARFANYQRTVYKLWIQRPGLRGKAVGISRNVHGAVQGWMGKVRAAAKAEKGVFETGRSARAWWVGRMQCLPWKRDKSESDRDSASGSSLARMIWEDKTVILLLWESADPGAAMDLSPAARVAAGRLGDLVDFAQQNPRVISPTRILGLRERFRKGDRALIQWRGSRPVKVAWFTTRSLPEVAGLPEIVPPLGAAAVVYELWQSQFEESADLHLFLNSVVREAESLGLPLWVSCTEFSSSMWSGLLQQGFQKRLEVRQQKLFGKTIRESVVGGESLAAMTDPPETPSKL